MCYGWGARLSPEVSLQDMQLFEGLGMTMVMQEALGPHQPQLPLHVLQLKVETLPGDAVLPKSTHRQLGVPCALWGTKGKVTR